MVSVHCVRLTLAEWLTGVCHGACPAGVGCPASDRDAGRGAVGVRRAWHAVAVILADTVAISFSITVPVAVPLPVAIASGGAWGAVERVGEGVAGRGAGVLEGACRGGRGAGDRVHGDRFAGRGDCDHHRRDERGGEGAGERHEVSLHGAGAGYGG